MAVDELAITLGLRIQQARKRLGMTQRTLSKQASYELAQLNKIENGKALPRSDALARIALALNVSTDQLLGINVAGAAPRAIAGSAKALVGVSLLPDLREGNEGLTQAERIARIEERLDALVQMIGVAADEQAQALESLGASSLGTQPRRDAR